MHGRRLPRTVGRVELVAVGVEPDRLEPATLESVAEPLARGGIGEQIGEVQMRRSRPVAGVHLDACDAKFGRGVEQLLETEMRERVGDDPDLHGEDLQDRKRSCAGPIGRWRANACRRISASSAA